MKQATRLIQIAAVALTLTAQALAGWTTPVALATEVNTAAQESGACLSADNLTLYFTRWTDHWRIFRTTRSSDHTPFTPATEIELNVPSENTSYPWVSVDGLRIYYTQNRQIRIGTRASVSSPWTPGPYFAELSAVGEVEACRLSADERTIVFTRLATNGKWDMYLASRLDTSLPFGSIRPLTELNTSAQDNGASLSADGLTLYFHSDRTGDWLVYESSRSSLSDPFGAPSRMPFPPGFGQPTISMDGQTMLLGAGWDWYSSTRTPAQGVPVYSFANFVGQPGDLGNADGTGNAARFDGPQDVALDVAGNAYIADHYNHTIRKVTPAGMVTTLAGSAGVSGTADGTGSAARFFYPAGLAVDAAGNVFVADQNNNTIRKVTPAGVVTTLAGRPGVSGNVDGLGDVVRFGLPRGMVVDSSGNVFVSDWGWHTIRKLAPTVVVTTVAGSAGNPGSADGSGSTARFNQPGGIALDSSGNLFIADYVNHTIRKVTSGGVVTTLAGSPGVYGSADGTGATASFYYPSGMTLDGTGNLVVADQDNNTIRKVTPAGVVTTLAGKAGVFGSADGPGSDARFAYPRAVVMESSGNFLVVEQENHTIRRMTPEGAVTTVAGSAGVIGSADGTGNAARFHGPIDVALDVAGNAYVADHYNHTIRKVTTAGVVTTLAGSPGLSGSADGTGSAARFFYPAGLAVDATGNVFVADQNNNTIRKVTPAGVVTTIAGSVGNMGNVDGVGGASRFGFPTHMGFDGSGSLFLTDWSTHTIRKLTPAMMVTTLAGSAGNAGSADGTGGTARFNQPNGVTLDSAGTLFIADYINHTIRKMTPDGVVTTLAGSAGSPGSIDGTGTGARFNHPSGLAVDRTGDLIITDQVNETIRKMTPDGIVTTLAGSSGVYGSADGTGADARFWAPRGVAVNSTGTLVVVDQGNHRITRGTPLYPPLTIVTQSPLAAATEGTRYTQVLTATGGMTPYTWSVSSGTLPTGLSLIGQGAITGTPNAATVSSLTVQVASGDGQSATQTFVLVVSAALVFSPVPLSPQIYDTLQPLAVTGGSGSGAVTFTVVSGPGEIIGESHLKMTSGTGMVTVRAIKSGDAVYGTTHVDVTVVAAKAPLTVTADAMSRLYGDSNPPLTMTYTGFVNGDAPADLDTPPSSTCTATPATVVGTYPIVPGGGLDDNYTFAYLNGALTVTPAPLTCTAGNKSKVYGTANSALTISYTGLRNGQTAPTTPPTIACAADATSPVGTYPITLTGGSGANYALTLVNGVMTVIPAPLTCTADNKSRAYGGTNPVLTISYTGLKNGQTAPATPPTVACAADGTSAFGAYPITLAGGSDPNYTLTLVNGTLTVGKTVLTVTADAKTRFYGDGNPPLTVSYTGFQNGDGPADLDTPPSSTCAATPATAVGTYPIVPAGGADNNYTFAYVNGAMTVAPAPLTCTAGNKSKVYGSANPALTITYTGLKNGQTAPTTPPTIACAADATSPVGAYLITLTGGSGTNYALTLVNGVMSVTQAPLTCTADNKSKAYGSTNPVLTISYTGLKNGQTAPATPPAIACAADETSAFGAYPITLAGGSDPNYTLTLVNGALTVGKTILTVTADAKTRFYGDANPPLTVSYTGFRNGDGPGDLDTPPPSTCAATPATAVGTYPIVPAGGADNNYTFAYVNGALTVTPAPLTCTAGNKSKVYGSANPALTISYTGLRNGQTAPPTPPTIACAADATSPVGAYLITLTGGSGANYALTLVNGVMSVTPAPLTCTADNKSRAYGSANPVLTISYTGLKNGQTAPVTPPTIACAADGTSVFGAYPITLAGGSDPNYALTLVDGTLTVGKTTLTVMADARTRFYGDANPPLTVSCTGFQNGDGPGDLDTPPTVTCTATVTSAVGSYAIVPAGGMDNNYTFAYVNGALTVTPAPLTCTADNKSKVYGSANPALTISYAGLKNGQTAPAVRPSATCIANAASPVGAYPITLAGGSDPNYALSLVSGTLTLGKATLTVTADEKTRFYGDANPPLTMRYTGFVNGEGPADLDTPPTAACTATPVSGVGPYPIVPTGGTDSNYAFVYVNNALTVTPAPLICTADSKSRAYGSANLALTITYTGLKNGQTAPATPPTITCEVDGTSPVGAYPITLAAGDDPNYTLTLQDGTLTVGRTTLIVTADEKTRFYGDTNPVFTMTYTGFANGDDAADLGAPPMAACAAVPGSGVGTYPIVPAGGIDNNYAFVYVNNALTVTPTPLTCTADSRSRAYGIANPALTISYTGLKNGQTAPATPPAIACAASATSPVGAYPITLTGGSDANYTLTLVNGTLTVGKADQVITFASCPLPRKAVGQAPFALAATATSGLPVTFSSSNPAVATVTGNTVALVGAGTTTIAASQGGNASWDPAPLITCDLVVMAATADFVVTEIRLDPVVPAIGSTFTAYVTVQNIGSKSGNGGALYTWIDRPAQATVGLQAEKSATVGTLTSGQTKTVTFPGLKAGTGAGQRILRAFVDAKAQTAEIDETNNQRTLAWHAGRPDFVVTRVVFTPEPPAAGGTFTARVTVRNVGESAGDAGYVDVWVHAPAAVVPSPSLRGNKGLTAATLLPGQEKTLTFTALTAAADDAGKTFRAVVDSRTKTLESNEDNNQFTQPYQVGRPDFVITNISFSPDPVTCGKTFTAYATVKNTGNAAGDAGYLDIWLNRPVAPVAGTTTRGDKYATVGTLAVGQEKQLKFTSLRSSSLPEDRVFRALVDSRTKTVETDELNNQDTKDYSCAP